MINSNISIFITLSTLIFLSLGIIWDRKDGLNFLVKAILLMQCFAGFYIIFTMKLWG